EDPKREKDRLAAIRGLAALGPLATDAYASLEKLMMDRQQSMTIRAAATNAVMKISGDGSMFDKLVEAFFNENVARQDTPEFRQESIKLHQAIQQEKQ